MVENPKIDFTKIDFPSDGLTVKTLRKVHPDQIDADAFPSLFSQGNRGSADNLLGNLLHDERTIAEAAFNGALGKPPHEFLGKQELQSYADELSDIYTQYGLATGKHHAQELIRGIEAQGIAQARQLSGKQP
jgi:hypothetical protein